MLLLKNKKKKIYFYFVILLLLTTISNNNLSNFFSQEFKIKHIQNFNDNLKIKEIYDLKHQNIFDINKNNLDFIISSNPLIKYFEIKKIYPNTLKIELVKTKPIAKILDHENNLYIGDNGKKFSSNEIFMSIPKISGETNVENINHILKTLKKSEFKSSEINIIKIYPSKRFDLIFKNGKIIKFPIDLKDKIIDYAYKLYNNDKMGNIIDLRSKNKVTFSK